MNGEGNGTAAREATTARTAAATSGDGARAPLRLGGMAMRNGLLIHGPRTWAIAARTPDGRVEVRSGPKPVLGGQLRELPLLRGPIRLAEAFALIPVARRRLPSARLPFEDPRVIGAAIAATVGSAALRRLRPPTVAREVAIGLLGTAPALAALRDRDLAAYHAVEHKAIGAYERGLPDPTPVPKEHNRCGSNLIAPLLGFSVTGQLVVDRLAGESGPVPRAAAALASISAAVEVFAYAERHPDSAVGRAVHGPGYEIQRLISTREPTTEQLEVGRAALQEILRAEAKAAATA